MLETDKDRHALIPIGFARLDEDNDQVMVDNLDVGRADLPPYGHEPNHAGEMRHRFDAGSTGLPCARRGGVLRA